MWVSGFLQKSSLMLKGKKKKSKCQHHIQKCQLIVIDLDNCFRSLVPEFRIELAIFKQHHLHAVVFTQGLFVKGPMCVSCQSTNGSCSIRPLVDGRP